MWELCDNFWPTAGVCRSIQMCKFREVDPSLQTEGGNGNFLPPNHPKVKAFLRGIDDAVLIDSTVKKASDGFLYINKLECRDCISMPVQAQFSTFSKLS